MSGCLTIAVVTLPRLMMCQQNECDARGEIANHVGHPVEQEGVEDVLH